MGTTCPRLRNATQLAHQRGLLPKKEVLTCEYEGGCDQVDCIKSEEPNFRPIFFKQNEVSSELSQKDKFLVRVGKCLRIIRERG